MMLLKVYIFIGQLQIISGSQTKEAEEKSETFGNDQATKEK